MAKDERGHGSEKRGGKSKINYSGARAAGIYERASGKTARPVRTKVEALISKKSQEAAARHAAKPSGKVNPDYVKWLKTQPAHYQESMKKQYKFLKGLL